MSVGPTRDREELVAHARALVAEWACAAAGLLPDTPRIDAHCHLGTDSDGSAISCDELLDQLDAAGVGRALVTALHDPRGYDEANAFVVRQCEASGGRLHALHRIDPRREACADDARRGLAGGAVGLKLHPRAEEFAMGDPAVRAVVEVAAEHHAPVLVHAGRGMAALGRDVLALALDFPGATIVLAHAAISDLAWLPEASADVPNVVFDTSWWMPDDIACLLASVPPSRVLFGSDPPYGTAPFGLIVAARVACQAGYVPMQLSALFGGNVARIAHLDEAEPLDAAEVDAGWQPAPAPAHRSWPQRRCADYLVAAGAMLMGGSDPDQLLELADNALGVVGGGNGEAAGSDASALHGAIDLTRWLAAAGERREAMLLTAAVLAHAATPSIPVPPTPAVG